MIVDFTRLLPPFHKSEHAYEGENNERTGVTLLTPSISSVYLIIRLCHLHIEQFWPHNIMVGFRRLKSDEFTRHPSSGVTSNAEIWGADVRRRKYSLGQRCIEVWPSQTFVYTKRKIQKYEKSCPMKPIKQVCSAHHVNHLAYAV